MDLEAQATLDAIRGWPRVSLGWWPTPLHPSTRLSSHLGTRVLFKREDTGPLALGGNKTRKLELILGRAISEKCNCVITTGAVQSNHCRLTAAAAASLGLDCYLVLRGESDQSPRGNPLLDRLFGAAITTVPASDRIAAENAMQHLEADLKASGRKPFVIPLGGNSVESIAAFIECIAEIRTQLLSFDTQEMPEAIVVACGSATTFVGLWLGARMLLPKTRVVAVTVSDHREAALAKIRTLTNEVSHRLAVEVPGDPEIVDGYVGEGYGLPTPDGLEALRLAARLEGILFDTTYTAKAFAGLIGELRHGILVGARSLLFVHTGGTPALFAQDPQSLLASDTT